MLPYFMLNEVSIGGITVQVWGLFVALGFLAALIFSLKEARKEQINEEIIWDVMILALLGMIAGGRIFYLLAYSENGYEPWFNVHSGFSLAGGAIAAGIMVFLYLKRKKSDTVKVFNLLTPGFVIALIFVRIGCFLINDHIGRPTALPWGIISVDGVLRHPVVLYEILFLIGILPIILKERKNEQKGMAFLLFANLYAVFRFLEDFLRCGDLSFCEKRFMFLTATQWILLLFLGICFGFYLSRKRSSYKNN